GGYFSGGSTDIHSYDGVSGIIHNGKTMFLAGVFLDDSSPMDPAPARLDFTGSDNFAELSPALSQTFYVGDGLTETGAGMLQQFHIPQGATRLFLGFSDGHIFSGEPGYYEDNEGQLSVEIAVINTLALESDVHVCDGTATIEALYSNFSGATTTFQWFYDGALLNQTASSIQVYDSGEYAAEIAILFDNQSHPILCTQQIDVNIPEDLVIEEITIARRACGDFNNGSIEVIGSGGSGDLYYSINGTDFQSSNIFDNLPAGIYTATIKDDNNCTETESVEMQHAGNPGIVLLRSRPITCNQDNGIIEIMGNGGTPPFEYTINESEFQPAGTFSNLAQGAYNIYVQDSLGCTDSIAVQIGAEAPLTISGIDVIPTTCGKSNGSIAVTVNGDNQVTYSVNGGDFQSSNIFEGLASGDYLVAIQDDNDCIDSQSVSIEPSESPLIQTITTTSATCGAANGSIIVDAVAGSGNLEYALNGNEFQPNNTYAQLPAGNYAVVVKDENDCTSTRDIQLEGSPQLKIHEIQSFPAFCEESNGGMSISLEGGTGKTLISLNGGDTLSNLSFHDLPSGQYSIMIMDEVGCEADTVISVDQGGCPLYIPNAFSPNNDGINDVFRIYPYPGFKGVFKACRVFNRWGALVYEVINFEPESSAWDGTYKGEKLADGVYIYYVAFTLENGETNIVSGDVSIIR
ncbi:MAG: gliding motility-associated C-terminal domain-containing protein, partial [Phaeodactylibacter sp.]|nr:gliding motility-associated C-terminal domain-containing protein [Phaeodactylibacter sp.]